jgi:hypothetical protein
MLQTYKAILNRDRLEWNDEIPEAMQNEKSVSVFITILEEENTSQDLRPYGLAASEFVVSDDFDAPLPEGILADFES